MQRKFLFLCVTFCEEYDFKLHRCCKVKIQGNKKSEFNFSKKESRLALIQLDSSPFYHADVGSGYISFYLTSKLLLSS